MRSESAAAPQLDPEAVSEAVRGWLAEDRIDQDATTHWCVPSDRWGQAVISAKESVVVAGTTVAHEVFAQVCPDIVVTHVRGDGAVVGDGDEILVLRGPIGLIISAERTALNILQRMSGIATATHAVVAAVEPFGVKVYDTRKTAPGLRLFDKYAMTVGGGHNHRLSLGDMAMIKENHVIGAGGVAQALERVAYGMSSEGRHGTVVVEVESVEEFGVALRAGATWLMMDNFEVHEIMACVEMCERDGCRPDVVLEASGNISLSTAPDFARLGIDVVSLGALSHSCKAADLSLRLSQPT